MWMSFVGEPVLGELRSHLLQVATHPGERGLRGLAHDLAELPGDGQPAGARHRRRLDEEHLAAHRRPRQAGGDPRDLRAPALLGEYPPRAQMLPRPLGRNGDLALGLALGDLACDLAADRADLALEVADAGLARVLVDDRPQRGVGECDLPALQAVGLDLAGDEVALGDVKLLVLSCSPRAG